MLLGNPYGPRYRNEASESLAGAVLADYLKDGVEILYGLHAPFAAAVYDGRTSEWHLITDRVGLQHVYFFETAEHIVLCTSSLALASVCARDYDSSGIISFLMAGYIMDQRTFFKDIQKVDGGIHCVLSKGKAEFRRYWRPPVVKETAKTLQYYGEGLAELHARAIDCRLDGEGGTTVELTAGYDSRMNLANALRSGKEFSCWTIGEKASCEVQTGLQLMQISPFNYHIVSPSEDKQGFAEGFWDDFNLLVDLTDGETNCLNLIASPWSNRRSRAYRGASVSGLAGEILRGTYYPFFTRDRRSRNGVGVDRYLMLKTMKQVCGNLAVFSKPVQAVLRDTLRELLLRYFDENPEAAFHWRVDNCYFKGPAQRFVGRSCTLNNYFYRLQLPYFSNEIIDFAFEAPHTYKADGKMFAWAIKRSHPELSNVPVDSGLPARPLGPADAGALLLFYSRFGRKICDRMLIGMRGGRRPSHGSQGIFDLVGGALGCGRTEALLRPEEMASGFLYEPNALRTYVEKSRQGGFGDRSQLGIMLTLEMACRSVKRELGFQLEASTFAP